MAKLAGSDAAVTKSAIVEAAKELFGSHGYESTSVQDIVERAGITKGGFYYNFSSKSELLVLIQQQFSDYLILTLDSIVQDGLPSAETLRAFIEQMVSVAVHNRKDVAIVVQERRLLDDPAFASIRAKQEEQLRRLASVIREGQGDGTFRRSASPELLALAITGMCSWVYTWYGTTSDDPLQIAEAVADLVLVGLIEGKGHPAPHS